MDEQREPEFPTYSLGGQGEQPPQQTLKPCERAPIYCVSWPADPRPYSARALAEMHPVDFSQPREPVPWDKLNAAVANAPVTTFLYVDPDEDSEP